MSDLPGKLYIVATPIGNLDDISQRALNLLSNVDLIAAEDTRHSAKLLNHYSIKTRTISLHDHNERHKSQWLIEQLAQGHNIALISDAGTPLISDPGYHLVKAVREAGGQISTIPGPCAFIAALSISGLPTDKFVFEGFLPAKAAARQVAYQALLKESKTVIFYESTHRIYESVSQAIEVLGEERGAALVKELTKSYETVVQGTLQTILEWLTVEPAHCKGEFVLMFSGVEVASQLDPRDEKLFRLLVNEMPSKKAAAIVAEMTGLKKNYLYQWWLQQSKSH